MLPLKAIYKATSIPDQSDSTLISSISHPCCWSYAALSIPVASLFHGSMWKVREVEHNAPEKPCHQISKNVILTVKLQRSHTHSG